MSPVTLRVQISKVQARLLSQRDIRRCPGNLPGDERAASARTLVVEEDPIARIHPIRLAVIHDDPVRVQLCDAIRRTRVKRRTLALRRLDDLAVELRGGGLVEPDVLLEPAGADGVEETEGPEAVDVTGVFSHLKGDLDVRLGAEVVDLGGLDLGDDVDEVGAVA